MRQRDSFYARAAFLRGPGRYVHTPDDTLPGNDAAARAAATDGSAQLLAAMLRYYEIHHPKRDERFVSFQTSRKENQRA